MNNKCQSCKDALEGVDLEIVRLRSIIVRIRNVASGKDSELGVSDIVSLCDYVMSESVRVVGKDILKCCEGDVVIPLQGL